MKRNNLSLKSNESGVAAIIVSVMLIIILSLIVLAMSQYTTREQRQTLDRQLSDQAFYNAESGINDIAAYVYKFPQESPLDKKTCDKLNTPNAPSQKIGDIEGNTYTCVLYDKAPKSIIYDKLSISSPKVVPISSVDSSGNEVDIDSITVSWDDSSASDSAIQGECSFENNQPDFPASCTGSGYGGVRFELIGPALNREALQTQTYISYLMPTKRTAQEFKDPIGVQNASYPNNQGVIAASFCENKPDARTCSKTFSGINRNGLYLNLRSIYRPTNLTITGKNVNGQEVRFKDSQIMIDATGKATDVLRRVQVRVPATNQVYYPGFAMQSKDSICKLINVYDGTATTDNPSGNPSECSLSGN